MRHASTADRLMALFLLGMLVFSPPLLAVFRVDVLASGVPLLFLYLFGVWAILIVLLGLIVERGRREAGQPGVDPGGDN